MHNSDISKLKRELEASYDAKLQKLQQQIEADEEKRIAAVVNKAKNNEDALKLKLKSLNN